MSMADTPRSERVLIALFGNRNCGKSSLINALTNQDLAIVSPQKGTTTDPVYKSIEILPLGPCVLADTAGLDDEGELGKLRIEKSLAVLRKCDIALMVLDAEQPITAGDIALAEAIRRYNRPALALLNKIDKVSEFPAIATAAAARLDLTVIPVSAVDKRGLDAVKNALPTLLPNHGSEVMVMDGLVDADKLYILVCPIDSAAPKGRMILPQQQIIREVCDLHGGALVCQVGQLREMLTLLKDPPAMVITDSQVFDQVAEIVPPDVPLSSFSILFARYKGNLPQLLKGVEALKNLQNGDNVLIAEGCTHHRQKDDIGTVKIPRWLTQITGGKKLNIEYSSGVGFTSAISKYKLIIHCGGCMLTRQAMLLRLEEAAANAVPIVNYGVLIATVHGILPRVIAPLLKKT